MTFNLDSNIFFRGLQAQQNNQGMFLDSVARGIANYQHGQQLDMQRRQIEAEQNDPGKLAESGMMKTAQRIPTTPQEEAAMKVWQAKQRPVFDPITGQMMGAPDIFSSLGAGTPPAPQSNGFDFGQFMPEERNSDFVRGAKRAGNSFVPLEQAGMNPKEVQMVKEEQIKQKFKEEDDKRKRGNPMEYGDGQLTAAGFANRMVESNEIIDSLPEGSNTGKTGIAGYAEQVLSAIPSMGLTDKIGQGVVKMAATPEEQQYLNAAQNWIRANLRKESGAVIGPQEMIDEYATYFPVAGDSDEVVKQKKRLRETTTNNMKNQSAGAYELQYGGKKKTQKKATPKTPTKEQALEILRQRGRIQ